MSPVPAQTWVRVGAVPAPMEHGRLQVAQGGKTIYHFNFSAVFARPCDEGKDYEMWQPYAQVYSAPVRFGSDGRWLLQRATLQPTMLRVASARARRCDGLDNRSVLLQVEAGGSKECLLGQRLAYRRRYSQGTHGYSPDTHEYSPSHGSLTTGGYDLAHPCTRSVAGRGSPLRQIGGETGLTPCPLLHRDWAHRCHICTRTEPTPCPHLHRDWAHPVSTSAPGLSAPAATSAPGLTRHSERRQVARRGVPQRRAHEARTHGAGGR